ncbi:MAG TPA: hypothetical protein VMT58_04540 [Candidatus Binataceae bacterium]|nr:hypothetical protein [Candidatus Binataceae bacterium]
MNRNAKQSCDGRRRVPVSVPMAVAIAVSAIFAGVAAAAVVSGSMVYRDGSPALNRQLHFENQVSHDMYVAPTEDGGKFQADLPPGDYDLRAERGAVIKDQIAVGDSSRDVGEVMEPARFDPRRLFELEGVAGTILEFAAPSTANVTGRPILGMRYGHEAIAAMTAPATPAPKETPLGEAPAASPTSSSAIE